MVCMYGLLFFFFCFFSIAGSGHGSDGRSSREGEKEKKREVLRRSFLDRGSIILMSGENTKNKNAIPCRQQQSQLVCRFCQWCCDWWAFDFV